MDNNILSTIFNSYVGNSFKGIKALDKDDLCKERSVLDEFSKKHGLSFEAQSFLENEVIDGMTLISEYKGFISGFKLAVQMILEANS